MQLKTKTAAQNVVTQQAGSAGFVQGLFKTLVALEDLTMDVVVADCNAHRIASDDHALNNNVRVELQDIAVFAGAGLALVRITNQVFLTRKFTRHEAPLQASWKTRAAAAP